MNQVTQELLRFKECARHLWNAYFLDHTIQDRNFGFVFDSLEIKIFNEIVIRPLEIDWPGGRYRSGVVPRIRVGLQDPSVIGTLRVMCANGDNISGGKKWDIIDVGVQDLEKLEFVAFFGWDTFGFIDWPYVKCFDPNANRLVLIQAYMCEFFMVDVPDALS